MLMSDRKSHVGMAHFAGTGPAGEMCGACQHFSRGRDKVEGRCRQYNILSRRRTAGEKFPASTAACKYFGPDAQSPSKEGQ